MLLAMRLDDVERICEIRHDHDLLLACIVQRHQE